MALAPHAVEQFNAFVRLLLAPEEDGGIPLLKGEQAWIGRVFRVPLTGLRRLDALLLEPPPQPPIAVFLIRSQVDVLRFGEDRRQLRLLAERVGQAKVRYGAMAAALQKFRERQGGAAPPGAAAGG